MLRRNTITKKQVGEEIVYSAYTAIPLFIFKGNYDRNSNRAGMEAGAGGKAMEQCCFQLAPHGLFRLFTYKLYDSLPNGVGSPLSITS